MPDPDQLPHIVKLLEDESLSVQKAVAEELLAYGPDLDRELEKLGNIVSSHVKEKINRLLENYHQNHLKEQWPHWEDLSTFEEKIEYALHLIAEFQNGPAYPHQLKECLDELAQEYRIGHGILDPLKLANFLFKIKGFKGNQTDFYDPLNSNLVHVIETKRGIPISLALIYILTGARLGIPVEGCNFPGHFLARVKIQGKIVWVDCFSGGRVLDEAVMGPMIQEMPEISDASRRREALYQDTPAEAILARMLSNLIRAYELAGNQGAKNLMEELRDHLRPSGGL
ncbi:MAG: hypothetical protein HYZ85_02600 [Candidatus Omnitrophica bacterium]|nr:hypothetical protein [Candidatus Omnitrophota bacterium]